MSSHVCSQDAAESMCTLVAWPDAAASCPRGLSSFRCWLVGAVSFVLFHSRAGFKDIKAWGRASAEMNFLHASVQG